MTTVSPPLTKVRLGLVGLGKMGLSHVSIFRAQPDVEVVAVCDSSSVLRNVLSNYAGLTTYSDFDAMLEKSELDAVVIATPSHTHASMVRTALERGLHVFCEKPFTLSAEDSEELALLSAERGLVSQVGYHNRFVGAFAEVKALLEAGAIGDVTRVLAEAYGPVVLKEKGSTWRSQRKSGGGCLYDYAAHAIDLVVWYLGQPTAVGGTILNSIFSRELEDEVTGTLFFADGVSGQLSVNWSDESQRKMSTRVTLWGTKGRIYVDRQECQVYLRDTADPPPGYHTGWNVKYTTELTEPVGFYLRGEEYSAQAEAFIARVREGRREGLNTFEDAQLTDTVIAMMIEDSERGPSTKFGDPITVTKPQPQRRGLFRARKAAR